MANIEDLTGDLDAVRARIARAQDAAAAADTAAEQIASRAAASGFAGIAQNLVRVREAIREICVSVGALGQAAAEARAQVGTAPTQSSPEETINALSPVVHRVGELRQGISAAVEQVDRAKQLAAAALHGGQPGPLLARLDAIRQVLVAVADRAAAARQRAEAVAVQAGQVGDSGN